MVTVSLSLQALITIIRVAFYTLYERKVLGYVQERKGPNKPSLRGLLIPFADAIKLVSKEIRWPDRGNKLLFFFVPSLALLIPLLLWIIYPSSYQVLKFKYSALFFICISSVGVYAILGAGWGRNRKYSLLGAVRAVAQSISYEVRFSLIIIHCVLFYFYEVIQDKSTSLCCFLFWAVFLLLVSSLAETNRSPFDFTEGESELVRGFNTEFSAVSFLILFLAEYISILFISMMISALFCMSVYLELFVFSALWATVFIWTRGTLPRLRYDQLMFFA